MSWRASNGHHYVGINRDPEREISEAEYQEFEREAYSFFARGWVLFSFIALCLWHFVMLRLRLAEAGIEARATSGEVMLASVPATLEPVAAGPPSTASTLAIVGIWLAVLASSTLQFMRPIDPAMCSAEFQPPFVVALMPFVVFGIGAILIRHSPFYSTWIAQIVDAKYGPKAYETFLVRLKPILLFGMGAFANAAVTMDQCGKSLTDFYQSMTPTFFASTGAACVMMHLVMRWRKLPGV
jgi:hypothetical protein